MKIKIVCFFLIMNGIKLIKDNIFYLFMFLVIVYKIWDLICMVDGVYVVLINLMFGCLGNGWGDVYVIFVGDVILIFEIL